MRARTQILRQGLQVQCVSRCRAAGYRKNADQELLPGIAREDELLADDVSLLIGLGGASIGAMMAVGGLFTAAFGGAIWAVGNHIKK